MSNAIMVRQSSLVRLLTWARALKLAPPTGEPIAGNDFGSDVAVTPSVSPLDEMSAYTIAWIYIAVQTCAADLASLPRYVERNGEALWEHPALDLLAKPRRVVDPVRYHRQRWADWYLAGNAYDRKLRATPTGPPISLQRWHPARVSHITASSGDVRAYQYATGGESLVVPVEDMLVCSDISYEAGPDGTRGMSRVRALMRELNVDVKALDLASQSVGRGAPAFLVRPSQDGDEWSQDQSAKIAKTINKMLTELAGGALVLGGRTEVTSLGYSPRDVEYLGQRELTRQTILSAFRLTPTIVGLPGANFATADKEAENYWQARKSDAALRDSADSQLAEEMGQPGDRIVTDFTGVAALKADRGMRLDRAQQLWIMGVPLQTALESEGLGDIELPESETAQPDRTLNGAQLQGAIQMVEKVAAGLIPRDSAVQLLVVGFGIEQATAEAILATAGNGFVPTPEPGSVPAIPAEPARVAADWLQRLDRWHSPADEAQRTREWRAFEDSVRGPAERRLAAHLTRYLRGQAERIVSRLEAQRALPDAHTRNLTAADIVAILDAEGEIERLIQTAGPEVDKMIERAIEAMARKLGVQVTAENVGESARFAVTRSLTQIAERTNEAVSAILHEGIAEGTPVGDMAVRIRGAGEFAPSRALAIARTEATKAVNAAGIAAIEDANDNGAGVTEIEWLTSRDGEVRDAHQRLDGKRVKVGQDFEIDGDRGAGPGQFAKAKHVVNCRCTVLPVLDD